MDTTEQHITKEIVFAGGCFWCTEAIFSMIKGVLSVEPGYTGGHTTSPTYEEVHSGRTGHAECVRIVYDPRIISFEDLLIAFFYTHNPTTLNRQGRDIGTQYRSALYYTDEEQKEQALSYIAQLEKGKAYDDPIVTEIQPLTVFFPAEVDHKEYYTRNTSAPYCQLVIAPKVKNFEERFSKILKV